MYKDSFVSAIKSNGNVLREFKDTVYLKFGVEYSILLKNLENRRAVAKIFIDGTEVCDGGFVINPKEEVEIERFVKDLDKGNRFKFIEKTAGVEAHRGNKIEDGLIRIEFEFEQVRPMNYVLYRDYYGKIGGGYNPNSGSGDFINSNMVGGIYDGGVFSDQTFSTTAAHSTMRSIDKSPQLFNATHDAGITVPGSISDQKFKTVSCYTDGIKHTMVFKLLGSADGQPVKEAVTVKAKPKCVTCGKINKATAKFCIECGTALQIV